MLAECGNAISHKQYVFHKIWSFIIFKFPQFFGQVRRIRVMSNFYKQVYGAETFQLYGRLVQSTDWSEITHGKLKNLPAWARCSSPELVIDLDKPRKARYFSFRVTTWFGRGSAVQYLFLE